MLCLSIRPLNADKDISMESQQKSKAVFKGFIYIHVVRQDAVRIYYFRNQGTHILNLRYIDKYQK